MSSAKPGAAAMSRIELLCLCAVCLLIGVSLGMLAAPPHPTLAVRNRSTAFLLLGLAGFVVLAIHRSHKEWRLRSAVERGD